MELVNVDPEVAHFVDNVLCGDISTPVTGQLALDVMVNPPKPGDPSYDTYTQVRMWSESHTSKHQKLFLNFILDSLSHISESTSPTLKHVALEEQAKKS